MLEEQLYNNGDQISIIMFKVGDEEFAIDLLDVKEIIQTGEIRRLPKSVDYVGGIFNYRGDIIHIINLRKKLNLIEYKLYRSRKNLTDKANDTEENVKNDKIINNDKTDGESKNKFIIIVTINNTNLGFFVDRILNISHIDVKDLIKLSPIFQTGVDIEYIKGIIRLDDRPRILINLSKILSEAEQLSIQKDLSS